MEPEPAACLPFGRRLVLSVISIAAALAIWMPLLHFVFLPAGGRLRDETAISPASRQLAQRHLDLWTHPATEDSDIQRMRVNNPEWDFMGRTFLVLSLANMSLREPDRQGYYLQIMDCIIDDTDRMVRDKGLGHFMLAYVNRDEFSQQPVRSIFIDGELALMLGARRLVAENEPYRERMQELVHVTADRMTAAPVFSCESYPDECWTFCNSVALAAIRIHEVLDGHDHAGLQRDWLARAKVKLVHRETGLLASSYTYHGDLLDGPEGSTIWMAAHCLQIVDPAFARDQYQRARKELAHHCLGFGWAGEWPKSWIGPMDVDSGPVIPIVDVSAGSSGQAFVGAAAFGDVDYYRSLATTLMLAGFPLERNGRMQFCASNQVGDAVLLYSTVMGPLWKKVLDRSGGVTSP